MFRRQRIRDERRERNREIESQTAVSEQEREDFRKRKWRIGSGRKTRRVTPFTDHRTSSTWPCVSAGGHKHSHTQSLAVFALFQ